MILHLIPIKEGLVNVSNSPVYFPVPSQGGEGRVIIGEWLVSVVVREAQYWRPRPPGPVLRPSVVLGLALGGVHWHRQLAGVVIILIITLGSVVEIQRGLLLGNWGMVDNI